MLISAQRRRMLDAQKHQHRYLLSFYLDLQKKCPIHFGYRAPNDYRYLYPPIYSNVLLNSINQHSICCF